MSESRIAKILQLKGEQKPLKIQNTFLHSVQMELKLVNFAISSNGHPQKIKITKAWPIPNLSIPHTSCSTQKLQKRYQHLQRIDIPSINLSDITVLIGAEMAHLQIHEECKAGKGNEPYAVRTKHGKVFMGGKSSKFERLVTNNVFLVHYINKINLEKFWNAGKYWILSKNDPKILTRDITWALNILETPPILKYKHYEIGLLWKTDNLKLSMNRELTESRFVSL